MTTFTILDPSTCAKKIARIGKVGKSLQSEIHSVAVSTLAHCRDHGDTTLAVKLLNVLPNGQRVKALANWYRHFSNGMFVLNFDKDSESWVAKLGKNRTAEDFNVDGAYSTNYADLAPEKGYSTLTVAGFAAFLKRKSNEEGLNPDGSPKVTPQLRDFMADLYAKLSSQIKGSKAEEPIVELDSLISADA